MRSILMGLTIVLALAFAGTSMASDGAAIYKSKCVACHGKDAAGSAMAPKLAGSEFMKGDMAAIKDSIKNGRFGDDKKYKNFPIAMPKWESILSDSDIDAVIEYLQSL